MEENEKIMEDLEKPWEQKLAEEKERNNAAAGNAPTELNDDNTRDDTMNNSAADSRVEPDNDGESAARILDSSPQQQQPIDVALQEEEKEPQGLANQLAMRKARRGTITQNDKSVPHVVNLNEDPQMSQIQYYSLTKGEILIGRKTGTPQPDIIIGATGIKQNHGKIKLLENGLFKLVVVSDAATSTFVNGTPLSVQKPSRILNHCDRLSFASCIYVFKYPKLRRALKTIREACAELNNEQASELTEKDQEELAWQQIQQQGLEGCEANNRDSLCVADYSGQEKYEDDQAADWDMAFNELEFGEMATQERIQKERDENQQKELEKQKSEYMEMIKQTSQ